jgi:hypothetical protein
VEPAAFLLPSKPFFGFLYCRKINHFLQIPSAPGLGHGFFRFAAVIAHAKTAGWGPYVHT